MKQWNPKGLSSRFLSTAENAEHYFLQCKTKAATNDLYKALHDEHLAKFYVFHYLHGRTFLSTPDEFLSELRSFLQVRAPAPREAFDGDRFLKWRQRFITDLIREVEDV